jgi:hypothetical protein
MIADNDAITTDVDSTLGVSNALDALKEERLPARNPLPFFD